MAKVHCFDDVRVHAVNAEMDGAIPIRPMEGVVIQFPAPRTIDEWAIPPAPLSIVLRRDKALQLAIALYHAAMAQKSP